MARGWPMREQRQQPHGTPTPQDAGMTSHDDPARCPAPRARQETPAPRQEKGDTVQGQRKLYLQLGRGLHRGAQALKKH